MSEKRQHAQETIVGIAYPLHNLDGFRRSPYLEGR